MLIIGLLIGWTVFVAQQQFKLWPPYYQHHDLYGSDCKPTLPFLRLSFTLNDWYHGHLGHDNIDHRMVMIGLFYAELIALMHTHIGRSFPSFYFDHLPLAQNNNSSFMNYKFKRAVQIHIVTFSCTAMS